jgi:ABC-type Fe3+-siderophore transport system permease subunit
VSVLRNPLVLGGLIGMAVGVLFVAVVTAIAGSDTGIWWWPAVAVAGVVGGAVLGSLFGAEAEGESRDEAYDGDPEA